MRISRTLLRFGFPRDGFLIPLAVLVGALAGLVAVGFGKMVEFSTEHLFGYYFANPLLFEGDRYLALVLLPAMGGLMVGIITHYARGKAGGHGIPDVIEALARRHGVLPKRSGLFKAVTASLTIGSPEQIIFNGGTFEPPNLRAATAPSDSARIASYFRGANCCK